MHIVVSGVGSDRDVVVELSSVDAKGTEFASRATFRSNHFGRVDLASAPATGGSYSGVDPMGLIDALQPSSGQISAYVWDRRHPQHFHVIATEGGSAVASGGFSRGDAPE